MKKICSFLAISILFNTHAQTQEAFSPNIDFLSLKEENCPLDHYRASAEKSRDYPGLFGVKDSPKTGGLAKNNLNSTIIEFRVSYFRPFSSSLRKLIGGGANYGIEVTIPVWKGLNVWGEVDYFSKSGTMLGIHRSVHITLIPITFGLKYIYFFNRFYALYGGAAGKYYFVEEINRVFPMHKTSHSNGLGGVFEIGNLICINHFVIDLFSSWSLKKIHKPDHLPSNATGYSMQVGGWNIGVGLGYKF